jgi:hypothetical protein
VQPRLPPLRWLGRAPRAGRRRTAVRWPARSLCRWTTAGAPTDGGTTCTTNRGAAVRAELPRRRNAPESTPLATMATTRHLTHFPCLDCSTLRRVRKAALISPSERTNFKLCRFVNTVSAMICALVALTLSPLFAEDHLKLGRRPATRRRSTRATKLSAMTRCAKSPSGSATR